jgi:hypothetical protein
MTIDSRCYLCDRSIDDAHASVTIPRLSLRVHLSCYERDGGVGETSEGTGSMPAARPPVDN